MSLEEFELVERPGVRILARRGLAEALLAATDAGAGGGAARGRVRFEQVGPERAAVRHYFRGGLLERFDRDRARARAAPLGARRRRENLLRLYRSASKLARARGERVATGDVVRFARAYVGEDDAALRDLGRALARYGVRLLAHRIRWTTM